MQGVRNGVRKQILDKEKRALGVHCFAHNTSLAVGDALKQFSPKRERALQMIKESEQDESKGIASLNPTRWTDKK